MKKIIIPIGALLLSNITYAQLSTISSNENYIQSKTYLDYNGTSATKSSETVQYFDGLGRPKQVVNVKASPLGRDVVTHIEYDPFGRQVKDYLPVPQLSTSNGNYYSGPLGVYPNTYGNEKIYSEKVLESSPLDKVLEQKQVGNDWNGKSVKFSYDTNGLNEVYQYISTTSWINGATKSAPSLSSATVYAPNQLYKNSVKDEDGNETIEFKNGKGQVVLVRKVMSPAENVDTYYVYNEYDQLAFVIPPLAVHKPITDDLLNTLCYQYHYDGRGRLVEKKLPGKGWEFMVYDKADRLMLTQDANMKGSGKWLMTKYDQFGRVAYTGIFSSNDSRATIQDQIKDLVIYDARHSTGFVRNGINIYYTAVYFTPESILSVNYYDSYPAYSFNPAFPSTIQGEPVLTETPAADGRSTKGLPVMSFVKNIEDDNWTRNYTYYDTKGRAIGSQSVNHLGGYTHTESKLDFAGITKQTVTKHKRLSTDTERVITETFDYDSQNRLVTHKHKIDNNAEEILAQNTYNEISQVTNKKVGGVTASSPLQQIDYQYNIRGWLTQINDPANLGNDLFGYKIRYNEVQGLEVPNTNYPNQKVKPKYNGNIAEVDWKTSTGANDNVRRYGYVYDPLNRLTAGFYQKDTNPSGKEYNELFAYDLNGNILNLVRTQGLLPGSTEAMVIDNLIYSYTGNRLTKVSDAYLNSLGYPVGGNEIGYDDNGNMTTQLDKGISSIQYNYLNLPRKITQNSKVTDYIYRADGVKVRKVFGTETTDYLDGFQYTNSVLKFFPTSEGYFNVETGKYVYNYTDHLGNVRLSYAKNGAGTEIIEESNYYPFGLKHEGYNGLVGNPAYKYKYQGQELQETGFYNFKWRNYMPDVGRFFNIDPLAEKFTYNSTYAFQENKLGMGVELEGLELLKNHTGFFAIHGNAMRVVRAPGSQMSNGQATFTAAGIGLTTKGYNPGGARISDGSSGLRLKSHAYSGPTPNGATMENVQETPESMDSQKFTTTKRGLEMTNKMIKNYDKLNTAAGGAQELVGLMDLASNIPDAIKSTKAYTQAAKDVKLINSQAKTMDRVIDLVNESGIEMNQQTKNDVINFVFDGTLPNPGAGLMPNSLIIQNGTQILRNNNLPVQPLNQQLNTNKKVLP
ncbi:DUF6443 domain-containing protein [Chryseobacterium cucumeris]|uniref:DUF6443 domain-containing protein n=1 Tax=Chryseobacterium cucumeris TaxID=1813611 RepID=UPI00192D7D80|nr:DUF6443 domain-containing protein [Chryseobacterium cucumeris]QRA42056.1 RHS repeat-associated core domain-containing protein [Chryseobacterium cucumeris]